MVRLGVVLPRDVVGIFRHGCEVHLVARNYLVFSIRPLDAEQLFDKI